MKKPIILAAKFLTSVALGASLAACGEPLSQEENNEIDRCVEKRMAEKSSSAPAYLEAEKHCTLETIKKSDQTLPGNILDSKTGAKSDSFNLSEAHTKARTTTPALEEIRKLCAEGKPDTAVLCDKNARLLKILNP